MVYLMSTDSIPIHRIEIGMAIKTPRQEEDEDDFNHDDVTLADNPQTKSLSEKQIDIILTTVTKRDGETDDKDRCRQAFVEHLLPHHGTDTSSDSYYFT